jgi:DNA primase
VYERDHEKLEVPDEELIFPPLVEIIDYTEATDYLVGRGIDIKLINHFKLKFCVSNVRIQDRLFYTSNRIIIPIHDISGKPISWQGRDITGNHLRYLFPTGFAGANFLYNAWAIKPGADYLIVSEGAFDTYGWWRSGFKNVVATFGKKISEAQVDMLRYLNPKAIFIAWDSDAMWENYEFIEKYGYRFNIKVINLGGKDADEMSAKELVAALSGAKGYDWDDKILSAI